MNLLDIAPFSDGRLFLAGRWLTSIATPVRSPWDGSVVGDAHEADERVLDEALAAAVAAAPALARQSSHERHTLLRRIADGIRARRELFAATIVAEAGKPAKLARAEVERAILTFELGAEHATHLDDDAVTLHAAAAGAGRAGLLRRFPVGVVVAITPFNFPLNLVAHKLAPAFATGCPVVLKPAEQTPLTALLLAHVVQEAGVVDGALSVVPASRAIAGRLVDDARPALVSFTGSADVGWMLKQRAGKKRVALELGGNAAVVLLDDADLDAAIPRIVSGAFAYAGQVCISVQRILAHTRILDDVRARLQQGLARIVVGDPRRPDVECGPMIDARQAARVRGWVDDAIHHGARVTRWGDDDPHHNVLAPQLLEGARPDARVVTDEVFGPVAVLEHIDGVDDAIARVNASRFGLQAGIFTNRIDALWRFYEAANVGAVIHNDAPTFRVDHMPYGGVKDSGFGREGLPAALHDYTQPRLLALRP